MEKIDCAIVVRPLLKFISESGDTGKIINDKTRCFLALVDVLGHGANAGKVAAVAKEYLDTHCGDDPFDVINGLHRRLSGSRGAVAAVCSFDAETEILRYTGVGNIVIRIIGYQSKKLVLRDGIVGCGTINPKISEIKLLPGDTLIIHSDGIREHFNLYEYPQLLIQDADTAAHNILEYFGTKDDDASCIVMKYLK